MKNSLTLKLLSLFAGIGLWSVIGKIHTTTRTLQVPVTFYGPQKNMEAPEYVTVLLAGKRADLYAIDTKSLALHINTDDLVCGENVLMPSTEQLFLPAQIKLVHWKPINAVVTVRS